MEGYFENEDNLRFSINFYGKMRFKNGDFYEGLLMNDKFEGYGRVVYVNGDGFDGEFS